MAHQPLRDITAEGYTAFVRRTDTLGTIAYIN